MSKDVDRQLVFQTTKVRAPLKRDGCWIRGVPEPTGAEDKPGKPELPKKPSGLLPSAESSPVASPTKTASNPCFPTKTTSAPCSPTKTTSPTLTSDADELLVSPTRPTRPVRQNSYVLLATKKFESVASPVAPTFKKPLPRSGKSDASITGNADDEAVSIVTEAAVRHAAADTPAETKSEDLSGNAAQGAQSADTGTANPPEEPISEQPAHLTEVAVETAGGGEGSAGESSAELMKGGQEISSTKPATEPASQPTVESTTEPDAAVPESSPQSEEPVTESAVLAEAGDGISEEPAGSQPVTAEPTADLSPEPSTENASDPTPTSAVGQEVEESTGESTEICKHVEKPVMETSVEPAAGEPVVAEAGAPGVELAMESTVENAESPEPVEEVVQESTGESSSELTDDPAVEVTQDPTLESVDAGPVVEPTAEPAVEAEIEAAVEAAVEPAVEQTVDAATLPAVEAERETSAVPSSPAEVEKSVEGVPGIRSKVEAPAEAVQESAFELEEALDAAKPSDEVVVASPAVGSLGPAVESTEPCSRESEPGQETDNAGSETITQTAVQQEVPHLDTAPLHHTEDGTAICSFCDKPIDGGVKITINYPPIYCHPGCFKCGVCALALGDMMTSMFLHGLVIHCDGCFSKLL